MNERMEELAIQSGIYGAVDINGHYDNELEVKKFAELIIKECAAMTRNLSSHGELAEKAVKEHFGVEV